MTEVANSRGREIGGHHSGYDKYHDRSSSRGVLLQDNRGERYGRANEDITRGGREDRHIRGDKKDGAGPETEMHGGGGHRGYRDDGGYSGRHEGGGGGYRDRGAGGRGFDQHGGRGGGGRGGGAGYGGGGGFGGGSRVASVAEGQVSQLHSNHFRFGTMNTADTIYMYQIEYGIFDAGNDFESRENRFEAFKGIEQNLRKILPKCFAYGKFVFATTMVQEPITLTANSNGNLGEIKITPFQSFSLNDQTSELRKKNIDQILNFVNKVVKKSLYEQDYKQIGRLPKFFNSHEKKDLPHFDLIVWPGYTCQVKCLNDGIFLNVDTSTKFL